MRLSKIIGLVVSVLVVFYLGLVIIMFMGDEKPEEATYNFTSSEAKEMIVEMKQEIIDEGEYEDAYETWAEIKGDFMEGCVDGDDTLAYCNCIFDYIKNSTTLKSFNREVYVIAYGELSDEYADIFAGAINKCSYLIEL